MTETDLPITRYDEAERQHAEARAALVTRREELTAELAEIDKRLGEEKPRRGRKPKGEKASPRAALGRKGLPKQSESAA